MLRLRLGQRHLVPILLVPAVLLVLPRAAQTQRAALTCPVIAGGGAIIVRGYEVVFSAASGTAGSTLTGLAVVRAPADFRSRATIVRDVGAVDTEPYAAPRERCERWATHDRS